MKHASAFEPESSPGDTKPPKKSRGKEWRKGNKQHRRDWPWFTWWRNPKAVIQIRDLSNLGHAMHKTGKVMML